MPGYDRAPGRKHVGLGRVGARAMPVLCEDTRGIGAVELDLPGHCPSSVDMIAEGEPHNALASCGVLAEERIEADVVITDRQS